MSFASVEVRHDTYATGDFARLCREFGIALVVADTAGRFTWVDEVTSVGLPQAPAERHANCDKRAVSGSLFLVFSDYELLGSERRQMPKSPDPLSSQRFATSNI